MTRADGRRHHAGTGVGSVLAVHRSAEHRFSKDTRPAVRLVEGVGIEGDAHAGTTVRHRSRVRRDPTQPNLRQVHLIHAELLTELTGKGHDVAPGALGENITTTGLDLLGLPVGTVLHLGEEARIELTGLRNPCWQIDAFRKGLLREVLQVGERGRVVRRAGVMAVVLRSGWVRPGDEVGVVLPPEPHAALALV